MSPDVQNLPNLLRDSLIPPTIPDSKQFLTLQAEDALMCLEDLFSIPPKPTATDRHRIGIVCERVKRYVAETLAGFESPTSELQRQTLSLEALQQRVSQSAFRLETLQHIASIIEALGKVNEWTQSLPSEVEATEAGVLATLGECRLGYSQDGHRYRYKLTSEQHRAYKFLVAPSQGTVLDEVKVLLGDYRASRLERDTWQIKLPVGSDGRNLRSLNQAVPEAVELAYFVDSHDRAVNQASQGCPYDQIREEVLARGTQADALRGAQYEFADHLPAILLYARMIAQVNSGGAPSPAQRALLLPVGNGPKTARIYSCDLVVRGTFEDGYSLWLSDADWRTQWTCPHSNALGQRRKPRPLDAPGPRRPDRSMPFEPPAERIPTC